LRGLKLTIIIEISISLGYDLCHDPPYGFFN